MCLLRSRAARWKRASWRLYRLPLRANASESPPAVRSRAGSYCGRRRASIPLLTSRRAGLGDALSISLAGDRYLRAEGARSKRRCSPRARTAIAENSRSQPMGGRERAIAIPKLRASVRMPGSRRKLPPTREPPGRRGERLRASGPRSAAAVRASADERAEWFAAAGRDESSPISPLTSRRALASFDALLCALGRDCDRHPGRYRGEKNAPALRPQARKVRVSPARDRPACACERAGKSHSLALAGSEQVATLITTLIPYAY